MAIAKEFIVNLKGKEYPVFAGVLDAAHRAGLKSLTTELIQVPSAENGMTAIVQATATFEDGRVFSDFGDCSPATTSVMLAPAAIRLASTRAKGRVLRDAVNVGQALLEELPDLDGDDHAPAHRGNGRAGAQPQVQQQARGAEGECCSADGCGKPLTKGQAAMSRSTFGRALCPNHQKAAAGRN
jgi:hypothetical protein